MANDMGPGAAKNSRDRIEDLKGKNIPMNL